MATIFLNVFVRSQLYWNPDADVDALLAEFYEKFYKRDIAGSAGS